MTISPVAYYEGPVEGKFGLPRQSGVAPRLVGQIRLNSEYAREEALRGLDGFDYLWLIWEFNLNGEHSAASLTVRPPRLGGNARVGVFASRSPFRPNPLGLSCVKLESIDSDAGVIRISGADLADGTPIYDIKPYVAYSDSKPDARSGFVDAVDWKPLDVEWGSGVKLALTSLGFVDEDFLALEQILSQDPRPHYLKDETKTYALTFKGVDVHFTVNNNKLIIV